MSKDLSVKEREFVQLHCDGLNGTEAAIGAGYAPRSAHVTASRLLIRDNIREAVNSEFERRRLEHMPTVNKLVSFFQDIAEADPNELSEVKRYPCRFCHGLGGKYQNTPAEREARWTQHQLLLAKTKESDWGRLPGFDEQGGVYDFRRPINPDCLECFGEGDTRLIIKPTGNLSPRGRRLYGGASQTKEGLKLILADQAKAAETLGKALGMFVDRKEISGPNGEPLDMSGPQVAIFHAVYPEKG